MSQKKAFQMDNSAPVVSAREVATPMKAPSQSQLQPLDLSKLADARPNADYVKYLPYIIKAQA